MISAVGVTEKEPVLFVIVNEPLIVEKSLELVAIVQCRMVALATSVVVTLNVPALPSLIDVGITPNVYVGGLVLVSLIVTVLLVATTSPVTLTFLILTVNVSAPSVVKSAVGVTEKDPVLFVIVNEPLVVPKSLEFVAIVQYNVVPLDTLVVVTLNVPELPSLIDVGITPNVYVGSILVSLIVTGKLVATTSPVTLTFLILTVNVSLPSVVISAVGVTENEPVLFVIANDPLTVEKSPEFVAIVQYSIVLLAILVVMTLNVPGLPSFIDAGITPNAYVGSVLVSLIVTGALVATTLTNLPLASN